MVWEGCGTSFPAVLRELSSGSGCSCNMGDKAISHLAIQTTLQITIGRICFTQTVHLTFAKMNLCFAHKHSLTDDWSRDPQRATFWWLYAHDVLPSSIEIVWHIS